MVAFNSITTTLYVVFSAFVTYWLAKQLVKWVQRPERTVPFYYFVIGALYSMAAAVVSTYWVVDYIPMWPGYGISLFCIYVLTWVKPYQKNLLGTFTGVTWGGIAASATIMLISVHFPGGLF